MIAIALGDGGLQPRVGVAANTPGAVHVVALGRHKVDGVVVVTGQSYWVPRERAEAAIARDLVHEVGAGKLDWWGAEGRVLSPFDGDVEQVHSRAESAGALRIAAGCGYDPGSAAYRFHSAVNQCTKHASVFTRFLDTNPHSSYRQLDGVRDAARVRESLLQADILHCHMNYLLSANATSHHIQEGDPRTARPVQWRNGQWVVRHYHGSRPDGRSTLEHDVDAKVRRSCIANGGGLVRVGARLTICAEKGAEDLQWLPIPMPVARYAALRAEMNPSATRSHPFRIAHSPTKRAYKGSDVFVRAVKALQSRGLAVEMVMIEGRSHGEALRLKATCDAVFDSFWLGLQGSGLEAGAMGLPCIAGDQDAADLHARHVGYVPYTFAGDQPQLERAIERLVVDRTYYEAEATRLARYVRAYHDYPVVARRYEEILASAMGRTDIITTEAAQPNVVQQSTRKRGKVAA